MPAIVTQAEVSLRSHQEGSTLVRRDVVAGAQEAPNAPRYLVPTIVWIGLILSSTAPRALADLPPEGLSALRFASVATGMWLVLVRPRGAARGAHSSRERVLFLAFLGIPLIGAALAGSRSDWGDTVNHGGSMVALAFAYRFPARVSLEAARRALLTVIGASLVFGIFREEFVAPSSRAYLRVLYDGRLSGLLGSANMLGAASVVLLAASIVGATHAARTVGVALALVAIAAASSQTSMVAAATLLALWGLLALSRRRGGGAVVVLSWSIFAAVLLVVWDRMASQTAPMPGGDLTFSNRTAIWERLLAQDVPVTGLGQTYIRAFFDSVVIPGATNVSSAHNIALDAYIRDGWVGVAALVLVLAAALWALVSSRRADALLPVGAMLLIGMVEVAPTHVPLYAVFFALVRATTSRMEPVPAHIMERPTGTGPGGRSVMPAELSGSLPPRTSGFTAS